MAPAGFRADISVATHAEPQGSAPAFLKALKAIGAGTAAAAHQPLPPGALRQVMARFDEGGAVATYKVATCLLRREAA
jgi:malonyl-CoA O-methyltransferase